MEIQGVVPLLKPAKHHIRLHLAIILILIMICRKMLHFDFLREQVLLKFHVLVMALLELGWLGSICILSVVAVQDLSAATLGIPSTDSESTHRQILL